VDEIDPAEISAEQLQQLDEQYTPFRSFNEWAQEVPRPDLWTESIDAIDETRKTVEPAELERATEIVTRAAALDTGAIEGLYVVDRGFTITVATQAAAWQAQLDERGENARALFQAQLTALELVLDVATNNRPVTEAWIRSLHEHLTDPQPTYTVQTAVGPQEQELPHGEYKRHPNHVRLADGGFHSYAPVELTQPEVHRLVGEISTDDFRHAHPVIQAAYAHHALTSIHPFADGNGRVARALASVYLYRAGSIPLLIFADRRFEYFDALRSTDLGNEAPFVRFVFDSALSAMALVVEHARTARGPDPAEALLGLRRLMIAQGELTHQELDAVAEGFVGALITILDNKAKSLEMPPGVAASVSGEQYRPDEREGFRPILARPHNLIRLVMTSTPPAQARVEQTLTVLVSRARDESETFLVLWLTGDEEMRFALRDVHPALTAASEQRLQALATRVIGRTSSILAELAANSLREAGYE